MPTFSSVSAQRLATCDPRLQEIMLEVVRNIDCVILEGHRGEEAQNEAVRKGTSKLKWPHGKHNKKPSLAVDVAPYFPEIPGKVDWSDLPAFGRLMGYIQRVAEEKGVKLRFGIDWDGDFRSKDESFLDAPHVEIVE
jgi:peptidoglycan L-alanyl-D-glutamate endopeptidase CwlK